MTATKLLLGIGLLAALGMLYWGLSGALSGRVMTKSYGTVDGERVYYRFVRRDEEPVWFWTLCGIYTSVGIAMLAMLILLLRSQAMAGG